MYTSRHPNYNHRVPRHNRVELNVLKLDADGNSIYDEDFDTSECHCFPRTSKKTIPSMLYDHINCPHDKNRHIQPAQQYVFTHPWSANSGNGQNRRLRGEFDEELSIIGEDDEFENNVTRTAPPFARKQSPTRGMMPYSAPVQMQNYHRDHVGTGFRQFGSTQSLTGYSANRQTPSLNRKPKKHPPEPTTPFIDNTEHERGFPDNPRHFQGHYMDPRDGRVYKFNVNYGKKDVQATKERDNTYR